MKKKVLCLILGLILTFSQVMSVSASQRKQELQQEKAEPRVSCQQRIPRLIIWKRRRTQLWQRLISWIRIW